MQAMSVDGSKGNFIQSTQEMILRFTAEVSGTTQVRLVHGEPWSLFALEKQHRQMGFTDVQTPNPIETVTL